MLSPSNFTIYPSTQTGDVYGTEFNFNSVLPNEYTKFVWSYGDNKIVYGTGTQTHIYEYPGLYVVELSAWTRDGVLATDRATVEVDYPYRDTLIFQETPNKNGESGIPGIRTNTPFTISLTSASLASFHPVVLHCYNSKSIPYYSVPEKWRHITPTWFFTDAANPSAPLSGALILSSTPIYKNGKVVATQAKGSFYYVDSLPTKVEGGSPLLLMATLSTEHFSFIKDSNVYKYSSFSNSKVTTSTIAWHIEEVVPSSLKISENYFSEIYHTKWAGVPIPILITCQSSTLSGSVVKDLSYPKTNEMGATSPVTIYLSSDKIPLSALRQHFVVDEKYFSASDTYGNKQAGYILTDIIPLTSILSIIPSEDTTFVVAASTVTSFAYDTSKPFEFPTGYPIDYSFYVPHPYKNVINKFDIYPRSLYTPEIKQYKKQHVVTDGSVMFINTFPNLTEDITNYVLSGFSGIYGIAYHPVTGKLYAADSDQNTISCYNKNGSFSSSVQLSSILEASALAPSYLSIDGNGNVWVSLYDDHKILKFDSNLSYLLSATPSNYDGLSMGASPVVETDSQNNVWACYASELTGTLVKFNENGQELIRTNILAPNSTPTSLAIDSNDGVWVSCRLSNEVLRYDSSGSLTNTLTGIIAPSYIALNSKEDLWILHGYNLCSIYKASQQKLFTWQIDPDYNTDAYVENIISSEILENVLSEDEIWGGLSIDVYDRAWLIDSSNNKVFCFNPEATEIADRLYSYCARPQSNSQFVLLNDEYTEVVPASNVRSTQAAGDWTGNKWYQKYYTPKSPVKINGASSKFKLFDINTYSQIVRKNETFNCAGYFKSLALPEILNQNTSFFDDFLGSVVGNGSSLEETLGSVTYEKIANFQEHHIDYETANVKQLQSIAAEVSIRGVENFYQNAPKDVLRLMNIFSIPKYKLRGYGSLPNAIGEELAEEILGPASIITANNYYLVKDLIYQTYSLLLTEPLSSGETEYPLSALTVVGMRSPIANNYSVYPYDINKHTKHTQNIIDWDSSLNTVSYTLSTNEEWYGDGGLVETMFNNLLTKQLYYNN